MSPDKLRIAELERQVKLLTDFMLSFNSVAQLSPQVQTTIRRVAGATTLENLSNVVITAPSNGQVLEYLGGNWINATDNT
jgi:hypothetical protein